MEPDGTKDRRILIVGGSSFIGRHLSALLGHSGALATYHASPIEGGVQFDIMRDSLDDIPVDGDTVSHIVLLSAVSSPNGCFADPSRCRACNVDRAVDLARQANDKGITFVFASTESIFDGEDGPYDENSTPRPVMLYGETKLEAERQILEINSGNLILRIASVYGTVPGDGTLCMGMLDQIARGDRILCATDQAFSPIHVEDTATTIHKLIERDAHGIYNVAGPETLTRLEILNTLIALYEQYRQPFRGSIETCTVSDLPTPEVRPRNTGLSMRKTAAMTGFMPQSVTERVSAAFKEQTDER
ncbi:MAG: sugar nucleotide-binding protein [Rhodospirillales bacterium]|nr:sugar nucleotide-binding protein [Rhodospirillales bacterium]MBO6787722.1 sugar nucleotide-binding protein [Rhodospirillales bacterium]